MEIDDLETAKERYAAYRLKGHGDGEAAELAGYGSSAPKAARELYLRAESVSAQPIDLRRKEQEADRLAFQLEQANKKVQAIRANIAIRDC